MATLTEQVIGRAGSAVTYDAADAALTEEFLNTGQQFVHIINADAGARIVTFVTPNQVDGDLAIDDRAISIPAGEERFIGPFPTSIYNDSANKVQMTWDANTATTIAVLRVGS